MNRLNEIAEKENLSLIEDAAQAIGSRYLGRASGSWGSFGCFSTHPLKNLNAVGDGGFIITQSKEWAQKIRRLRSHGLTDRNTASEFGFVSRMDEVQAAILLYRLRHLSDLVVKRQRNADLYRSMLSDLPMVLPPVDADHWDTFHTFVIQTHDRDRLQDHLRKRGVGTGIHYPRLISDQPAMSTRAHRVVGTLQRARDQSQQILSLPINQTLDEKDIVLVAQEISNFYSGK
jgi:dTDP-4-amino-4,6-dideoxygalactose transaminase